MQPLRGVDEAAGGDYDEKGAGEFSIHRRWRYFARIFFACQT
jgi:hypothetical protein